MMLQLSMKIELPAPIISEAELNTISKYTNVADAAFARPQDRLRSGSATRTHRCDRTALCFFSLSVLTSRLSYGIRKKLHQFQTEIGAVQRAERVL